MAQGIFARLFGKPKKEHKDLFTDSLTSGGSRSYMVMPGQPVWMDRNYSQFALEAYMRNVIAHRAMSMVANAAATIKSNLVLVSARGLRREALVHPVLDLLCQPNPTQAHAAFFQALYQYQMIGGNAYVQAVGPTGSPPVELHLLRPDRVAVIAGKNTMPAGYRYTVNGEYTDFPADRITGMSRILHLRNFHPLNDWYGLSPVEAAAYSIDQHNQAGAWNQALLQNGARPSGALVVKAESSGGGTLSEDQYNRVKLQIDDQFSGAANAGRPILLEGGLDWKEMSLTPKDMDFIEAKNSSARDIALAFGVPPQLLGIPGDNTYANLQEARLALWEQTVVPLVCATADALNNWLLPMFGVDGELVPETDNIPALAIRNQTIWDRVQRATFLTDDEKRAAVGYPPLAQNAAAKSVKKKTRSKKYYESESEDDGGEDPLTPTFIDTPTADDWGVPDNSWDFLPNDSGYQGEPDPPIDPVYPIEEGIGALYGGEAVDTLGEALGADGVIGMSAGDASALADQIASGHAFDKHVLEGDDFPDINTPEEFSNHIEDILTEPDAYRNLERDRTAYWDDESGTVVIHDPNNGDGGTAFVPEDGRDYFDYRLKNMERILWK